MDVSDGVWRLTDRVPMRIRGNSKSFAGIEVALITAGTRGGTSASTYLKVETVSTGVLYLTIPARNFRYPTMCGQGASQ